MNLKEKIIPALSTIPIIAATAMGATCAAGCPYYGLNCSAPGRCGRFTDSGGDGICDLAQSSTSASSNTQTASSSSSSSGDSSASAISSKTSASKSSQADSSTNSADQSANSANASNHSDINASVGVDSGSGIDNGNVPTDGTHYNVLPVSILLIGAYLFTYYLFKKGILNQQKHRRIWNLLVTAGYLGTGLTGVVLIVLINLGVKTALNASLVYWHAELAILMVIGTLIHVHIFWKPFKNMFKVLFGFKSGDKDKEVKDVKTKKRGIYSK